MDIELKYKNSVLNALEQRGYRIGKKIGQVNKFFSNCYLKSFKGSQK